MNNEFEWRNEMRKLGGPVAPENDLWSGIAARIQTQPQSIVSKRPHRARIAFALAASLIVAIGAGVIGQRILRAPANTPAVSLDSDKSTTALEWAQPANPKLAVAAQDLDLASAQLQDALEKRPDAVFLVGLLNRTNSQRVRLMRQAPYAG